MTEKNVQNNSTNTKKVALVVEDERPLSEAIKFKLEKHGFEVVTARTAQQALGYLEDLDQVDFIWLDHYLMGEETGLDFLSRIKNNHKWRGLPVFVVSNTATQAKIHSYIDLGINKYYTKVEHRLDDIIADIKNVIEK
jgi:CheY-like chemotaxis protein